MTRSSKSVSLSALAVLAGFGAAFVAAGASQAARPDEPLRCEISVAASGGLTRVEAIANAQADAVGTYEFRVTGAGTNIQQGGDFNLKRGDAPILGTVTIGGSGTREATLDLKVNGQTISCSQRL